MRTEYHKKKVIHS